jgi:tetratricopeptide (TPR) repeat protein
MSNRPRSHQIEDQSRIAFEQQLPKQWVYRPVRPDYGVDGSVEVFDELGQRTGKQFNVQLKATDEANLKRALAIRLKTKTCEYYRSLDLPILIVRFHAPTGKLFAKWFHEFDTYYAKAGKGQTTFRLAESDEWSNDTGAGLSVDLDRIRRLRSGNLPLPVPFGLEFSENLVHGLSAAEVSLSLRKAVQQVPSVLTLDGAPHSAYGRIRVSNNTVVVSLAGLRSFTLHFHQPYSAESARRSLHADILIGIALTFDSAGYPDPAARILAEFGSQSGLASSPEIALRMAGSMARAHRLTEALRLAEALLIDRRSRLAAQSVIIPVLAKSAVMSAEEKELTRHLLTRSVEEEEKTGDSVAAAISNYNLGNYLRSLSLSKAAFRHFRRAARLDPKYVERGYFCREIAGVLFGLGRYGVAAKLYARALDLGEGKMTRALFADALMFSGNYTDAISEFDAYVASAHEAESEFVLKTWGLKGLRRLLKCDRQIRQRTAAIQLATPNPEVPEVDFAEQLEKALNLDALCGIAWFNLGVCFAHQGKSEDALIAFLWGALVQRNNTEAWANAFGLSVSSAELKDLAPHIAIAARSSTGEGFMQAVLENAEAQPANFPKLQYLAAVNEILAQIPKVDPPFEVRMHGKTGIVHIAARDPYRTILEG